MVRRRRVRPYAAWRTANRHPGPACPSQQTGCPVRPGARRGLCHESACGRYPWLSGAFAPTQEEHKPEAQAKINTDVTRTKRHSPAYGGTRSTMTVTENSASLPAEMRVSWADYSFPGWWARDDRPSEKRKLNSVICCARAPVAGEINTPITALPGTRWHECCHDRSGPVISRDSGALG
jgi:hypothetical protein